MGKSKRDLDQDWRNYGPNEGYAQAMADLRKSGAAGFHIPTPNRERQRGQATRRAIRDQWEG